MSLYSQPDHTLCAVQTMAEGAGQEVDSAWFAVTTHNPTPYTLNPKPCS